MGKTLFERDLYTVDIPYQINKYIYEYDIHKANISILMSLGLISKQSYDDLYQSPRSVRQIVVGLWQRENPTIANGLKDGFVEMRKCFMIQTDLDDSEVFSIKKDAIYVCGKSLPARIEVAPYVKFLMSNKYTSYVKLGKLEIYYLYDSASEKELIDVKGIKDDNLELHRDYMIRVLCEILYQWQMNNISEALQYLNTILTQYVNKECPIGMYRNFDSESCFSISRATLGFAYAPSTLPDIQEAKDVVDGSCNLHLLRQLHSYLSAEYMKSR